MKNHVWIFMLVCILTTGITTAQTSCSKIKSYVKLESKGDTYQIRNSSFISKITFHKVKDQYNKLHYYAIVRFNNAYKDYVYEVNADTKSSFVKQYKKDAKRAFMNNIHPYNNRLYCGPNF